MSEIDRAELRRLLEEATPRPWEAYRPHPHYARYAVDRVTPEGHLGDDVATTEDVNAEANAQLIAAAVNALPGLLDALEKAEGHRDSLAAALIEVQREKRLLVDRVRELHYALGIWG